MVVALLYEMQTTCNCFTLSLSGSVARRPRRYDGDQGVEPVTMEMMMMLWRWKSKGQDDDGHIMSHILIACDVYLYASYFA